MPGRLQSKVALITGAGSGFGEAMAHAFTAEGAQIIVADLDAVNGQRVVDELNTSKYPSSSSSSSSQAHGTDTAIFARFDATSHTSWTDALTLAISQFGSLDIVVNNAGTTYTKQASMTVSEADFDLVVGVNQKSIYWSVVVVMPYFEQRGKGVFVNTSSVAGTRVREGQVWYGGTKGFVNTVTQGLAAEYGPKGVRVNSICPLRSATGLLEKFSGVPDTPEERARFAKSVPLGRMTDPKDVAMAAVYLASDEAAFVSGVCLPVDGGRLAV